MSENRQKIFFALLLVLTGGITFVGYLFINPDRVIYRKAEKEFAQRHFVAAIDLYHQALKKGLDNPEAYLRLAVSYTAEKDFKAAALWYRRYLDLFPHDNKVRLALARVLSYEGEYSSSLEEYRQLMEAGHEIPTIFPPSQPGHGE